MTWWQVGLIAVGATAAWFAASYWLGGLLMNWVEKIDKDF